MSKELIYIGTIELVSLPDDRIERVPAKIDTGADFSSIWASNIHLVDGKLVFNFFAPGSFFYRPEPVESSSFRTTVVRNSFGQQEFRYKIKLKVRVGDHTLTRWFSLADRSRNNYPILLGKNFLKKKFVVDVAQRHFHSNSIEPSSVLVLTRLPKESKEFFAQVSALQKLPVEYQSVNYDALEYSINGLETKVVNAEDNYKDLAQYSLVYFKNHAENAECASAAAEYLHYKGRPFVDRELLSYISASKLTEYAKLACYGLPVPRSISANTSRLKGRFDEFAQTFGLPFVLKEIASDRGRNNFLISNQKDYDKILSEAPAEFMYIVQEYIANDGFYRVYVLGKESELAVWRGAVKHQDPLKQHLNKPRGNANASNVPIGDVPTDVQDLAIKAAQTLERQVAGVDLVQDKKTKKWYILEVNNSPQIFGGSFREVKEKIMAQFIDQELNQ